MFKQGFSMFICYLASTFFCGEFLSVKGAFHPTNIVKYVGRSATNRGKTITSFHLFMVATI